MVNITINGRKTSVQQGTTILNAAKSVGVEIPHICYWEGLNDIGACRICVVELEGKDKLVSSCNTEVEEGMVIYTNSPRVRQARKINIQERRRLPLGRLLPTHPECRQVRDLPALRTGLRQDPEHERMGKTRVLLQDYSRRD